MPHPTAEEQCSALWLVLKEHNLAPHRRPRGSAGSCSERTSASCIGEMPPAIAREWPTYDSVVADVAGGDYSENLQCPHDLRFVGVGAGKRKGGGGKIICPHGVICQAKVELFEQPQKSQSSRDQPYTGLFTPGQTLEHCIVRLSSAMRPPNDVVKSSLGKTILKATGPKLRRAKLFPTLAIKAFRGNNVKSGNLLFSGCKVGQPETDFFAHCICTQLTEKVPPALKPIIKRFHAYSKHPLSLGLSDFCSHDVEGNAPQSGEVHFPYIVILDPVVNASSNSSGQKAKCPHAASARKSEDTSKTNDTDDPFDAFLYELESIQPGTTLFDIFCCPEPMAAIDPSRLQRIGRVITTSEMIPSAPDDNLFFRHQRREEDYDLKPHWKEHAKTKCEIGKHSGPISKIAGWKLFEKHIAMNQYVDFEVENHKHNATGSAS